MKKDEYRIIEILLPNLKWRDIFAREALHIKEIMGNLIINIHHIGSTAIPNIKAKSIIDMIPEVSDITKVDGFNNKMQALGYKPFGEYGLVGRRFFVKFNERKKRLVNAHFYQTNNPEILHHILFLEYMNNHSEDALAYSNLKEKLAVKFPHDIDSYCNGKDLFIKGILTKAGFNELYLREVKTDNEWFHYQFITKTEIFSRAPYIIYDHNHPSITDPNNKLYVFYLGVRIIGSLKIHYYNSEIAIIRLIAIESTMQNKGYGSKLLKQVEQIIQQNNHDKILLHTNPQAYDFYIKNGYRNMDFSFDQSNFIGNIDMGKLL